jgi:hypothetical protein
MVANLTESSAFRRDGIAAEFSTDNAGKLVNQPPLSVAFPQRDGSGALIWLLSLCYSSAPK